LGVTGTVTPEQHGHPLGSNGYALIHTANDGDTIYVGGNASGHTYSGGHSWQQQGTGGDTGYDSLGAIPPGGGGVLRNATQLNGSTENGGSGPVPLSGGATDPISIDTSTRGAGEWKTNAQDIDKMQPWIAFTVFIRAT
jgi:hypothetical protein